MRRFYKQAGIQPVEDGFAVMLDDRPVLTPGKARLVVAFEPLADAIAGEWQSQGETVSPPSMPLSRMANTTVDRVAHRPDEVAGEVAKFAETDLVCYRVAEPSDLRARQEAAWDPWLEWVERNHGARLEITTGLLPCEQPKESVQKLGAIVSGLDPYLLTGCHQATAALGSLVLALALLSGELSPDDAFAASVVDELFQVERWGEEEEAARARDRLKADIASAHRFMSLCRRTPPP